MINILFILLFMVNITDNSQKENAGSILYHGRNNSFVIKVYNATGFTVTLPLTNTGGYVYNFRVNWGDGSAISTITSATDADRIHAYASGGTYTIVMMGRIDGWNGNGTGMKEYLIEVVSWGNNTFKTISMQLCAKLVSTHGKLKTSTTSFAGLFQYCSVLESVDCDDWDVSTVTRMEGTFSKCYKLTTAGVAGVSNWNVSNVTLFGGTVGGDWGMFANCTTLTSLDLSNWTFSSSSSFSMESMFYNCTKLTTIGDVSGWNMTKCTSLGNTFQNCNALTTLDVSSWDVQNVTNFYATFYDCRVITTIDVSGWNVTKGTSMASMFYNCDGLTSLDLSAWVLNTTSALSLSATFANCSNLTTIGDVSGWNTIQVTNLSNTFADCAKITDASIAYVSGWDTQNVTDMASTFARCVLLNTIDVSGWNVAKCTNFGSTAVSGWGMFIGCTALDSLDLSAWTFSVASNIRFGSVFASCSDLEYIGDISGWDTQKFTDLQTCFYGCSHLDSVDVSGWNVAAVTNMSSTFNGCSSLTSLDVSGWTTSAVTNTSSMFRGCSGLTALDIDSFDMADVTTINAMFYGCSSITVLDVSAWVIDASCTNCYAAFYQCSGLSTINISGWDMTNVTATSYMFGSCSGLDGTIVMPSTLKVCQDQFATGCSGIDQWNFYPTTQPTTSGTPFGSYAVPLHVPTGSTSYNTAPWTTTTIFSSITKDL